MRHPPTRLHSATPIPIRRIVEYAAARAPTSSRAAPQSAELIGVPIGFIRAGAAVHCRDGRAGRVVAAVVHPRGYTAQLVVRHGRIRPGLYRVAGCWVSGIAPDYVVLSLRTHDLRQQPRYCPDDEITAAVRRALGRVTTRGDRRDFQAMRATVHDGVVTLQGNVRDSTRRLHVEQIVGRLPGVLAIHNQLFGDDEIGWNATWLLGHERRLQIRDLRCESALGIVQLHGTVAAAAERDLAGALALHVPGVRAVANELRVARRSAG